MKSTDCTGEKFGRLTAVSRVPSVPGVYHTKWIFRCSCGTEKAIDLSAVKSGKVISCGCNKREKASQRSTHGESRPGRLTTEYKVWRQIKKRCLYPKYVEWKYYGGRGITICDEWRNNYLAFLADVGRKPSPQHSIDRIEVNGNYEPGNCRWATRKEQRENRRDSMRRIDAG